MDRIDCGASAKLRRKLVDLARNGKLDQAVQTLRLDAALSRLATLDARQAKVAEMHFFADLSPEQIAECLGVPLRTAKRDWLFARAWLHKELRPAV